MRDSATKPSLFRFAAFLLPLSLPAQKPVINPGGIVNAASQTVRPEIGTNVASGGIATIYGSNLASSIATASTLPLPTSLGGTSVIVGGVLAPLFYVSPTQVNFQVPSRPNLDSGGLFLNVIVKTPFGESDPMRARNIPEPGAFTQDGSGCGPGVVLNVEGNGSVSLNTSKQSASPGSFITVYGTGLGVPHHRPPPDGSPATADPLSWFEAATGLFGLSGFEKVDTANTFFAPGDYVGRAPDLVGVDQINIRIPQDTVEGCAVPIKYGRDNGFSQPVTISIRKGGGRCRDAPSARIGSMTWVKTMTSGPEPSQSSTVETLEMKLVEAPGNQLQPLPGAGQIPSPPGEGGGYPAGPNCAGSAPRRLDAGRLTVDAGTGPPFTVSPSLVSGEWIYKATLPPGTIHTGKVRVAASGGADVEPFQTAFTFPPPIQITTALPPGTVINTGRSFQLDWTGGEGMIVRVRLATGVGYYQVVVPGDAGSATLPVRYIIWNDVPVPFFPLSVFEPFQIEVWISPRQPPTFSAPGLREPGTHDWTYKYVFAGMKTPY